MRFDTDLTVDQAPAAPKPSLRDRAMRCKVRELFGDRYEVTNLENGHRHYVAGAWLDGEVVTKHLCADKTYNGAAECRHEYAVRMHKRYQASSYQFN